MADPNAPLTEEDLRQLNEQLDRLKDAEEVIDRGIRGGIDLGDQKKRAQETRQQLIRLKTAYFPGR